MITVLTRFGQFYCPRHDFDHQGDAGMITPCPACVRAAAQSEALRKAALQDRGSRVGSSELAGELAAEKIMKHGRRHIIETARLGSGWFWSCRCGSSAEVSAQSRDDALKAARNYHKTRRTCEPGEVA